MSRSQFYSFDTYGTINRLVEYGISQKAAEELINTVIMSRDFNLSHFVKLEDLAASEREAIERFGKIETEIALIRQEIGFIRKDITFLEEKIDGKIDGLSKDMTTMEHGLRKDMGTMEERLDGRIEKSKTKVIKWIVGMFIARVTTSIGIVITIVKFMG